MAGLHFNENANRSVSATKDGVERYKVCFPKYKRGDHAVKTIMQAPTYSKFAETNMINVNLCTE